MVMTWKFDNSKWVDLWPDMTKALLNKATGTDIVFNTGNVALRNHPLSTRIRIDPKLWYQLKIIIYVKVLQISNP